MLRTPSAIRSPFYLMASELGPYFRHHPGLPGHGGGEPVDHQLFSITQQAVRLGYAPRMHILHTSSDAEGQIYAPGVNAVLFVAVVGLVLGFKSSSALAAAFGLTVTATMVLTTLMVGFIIFRIGAGTRLGPRHLRRAADPRRHLFAASATKFTDGGWLPATVALVLAFLFATWRRGRRLVTEELDKNAMPIDSSCGPAPRPLAFRGWPST